MDSDLERNIIEQIFSLTVIQESACRIGTNTWISDTYRINCYISDNGLLTIHMQDMNPKRGILPAQAARLYNGFWQISLAEPTSIEQTVKYINDVVNGYRLANNLYIDSYTA